MGWVLLVAGVAAAETKVTVAPKLVVPGDAVLVTVSGVKTPEGTFEGAPLHFFPAKGGFQALHAIPLDAAKDATFTVKVDGAAAPLTVTVAEKAFHETSLIVEDELANPAKEERDRIDADNKAIIEATKAKAKAEQPLARGFRRPAGKVTSPFGEWRTFNDGHRSQHLGLDLFAVEGAKIRAVNDGAVTLVRDCFLAGNVVVIAHGAGTATAYYHLSESAVAEGDVVARGAVIGLAGHTGRATGPHLHLSLRVPGGFVDPDRFFKLALTPIAPQPPRSAASRREKATGSSSSKK